MKQDIKNWWTWWQNCWAISYLTAVSKYGKFFLMLLFQHISPDSGLFQPHILWSECCSCVSLSKCWPNVKSDWSFKLPIKKFNYISAQCFSIPQIDMSQMQLSSWWILILFLIILQVAEWGMMSMCDAERRLLANALLDLSNEWFILLSESCIPVQNFSTVYHYISQSRHSFMGSFDEDGPYGRGRYNPNMAPEVNLTEWRKGSQWFEVNRELAVAIIQDSKYYPKFKKFCRPACYVDEHYFPTMLSIHYPNVIANRTLTWVDWSRGGAHPATFGQKDTSKEFFKRILESNCTYNDHPTTKCFLFARKFSPNTLEPLLALASPVFGIHWKR